MNSYIFEKTNIGYHKALKDISIDREWIRFGDILKVTGVEVRFWRHGYTDTHLYRIDIDLTLFGSEEKSITLYTEAHHKDDLQDYFNKIFIKI